MKTDTDSRQHTLAQLIAGQDPEALQNLAGVMSAAMTESQALISDVISSNPISSTSDNPDPLDIGPTFQKLGESLAADSNRLAEANTKLWQGLMEIWSDVSEGALSPGKPDRRFSDPEWSTNPIFNALRRTYELNAEWMMMLVDTVPDLSDDERRKASFLVRQTVDAYAPTNFFMTNPAALRALVTSGGASILQGVEQAREDIRKGGGKLTISHSDDTPFKLGENIATSPGEVIFRNDLIEVLQYEPLTDTVHKRPLLIFTPWINKFYILDLREENSMVRWLTAQGFSVFVVSWRSADGVIRDYEWDDYVTKGGYAALEAVLKATDEKQLNAVGYCIGGTMLSGLLAHMAIKKDDRIASATFFASQADFKLAGDLKVFSGPASIDRVETLVKDSGGIMPGDVMRDVFSWLRPVDLVWRYVVDNYMLGKPPRPFDILFWNADQTNIPGPAHLTYLRKIFQDNDLAEGRMKILGETVALGDVKIPIMIQASRDDHICPYQSVYRTAKCYGGPTEFILAGAGHIAGVVNPPDANKYQYWVNNELPGTIDDWMSATTETDGSWWPYWRDWLKERSGAKISARIPSRDMELGAAPGEYALVTLEDIKLDSDKGWQAE